MLGPKQGSRLEVIVLHRVGSFKFIGFQPPVAPIQQNMGQVPPPPEA